MIYKGPLKEFRHIVTLTLVWTVRLSNFLGSIVNLNIAAAVRQGRHTEISTMLYPERGFQPTLVR